MESKFKSARMRGLARVCLALFLGLTAAHPVHAQSSASTATVQADFDAAMDAIEQSRLRTARQRLQSLLAANPSLSRARLELARVHYLSRDYAAARTEARRVLDDPATPPTVRATVLAFLAQIDADERRYAARHQWSPSFYGGLMYDSNVNIGLARDIIDIGGLLFQVAPDSRETSDGAAVINAGIAHTFNPNRRFEWGEDTGSFVWQSEANAYYRAYFQENDFNLGVLTLRTGPAWIVPGRWRAYIGLQGDQIFLDNDNLALFGSLNPGIAWQVGDNWEVGLDGIVTERSYHDSIESGREGRYESANLTVGRYFRERRLLAQAGTAFSDFNADNDVYSYTSTEVFAGLNSEAWTNGAVFARVGYRWYDFDEIEPGFTTSRDDDELRTVVGFQHDYREGWLDKWSLIGSWTYTDNQSDVVLYEYDRHQVSLGLSRRF
jgi:Tfp pilus assembly protein PilF